MEIPMSRISVLLFLLAPAAALAHEETDFPWEQPSITFRVPPINPQSFKDVMEEVEAEYVPFEGYLAMDVVWDNENQVAIGNGENEAVMVANFAQLCPTAGGGCTFDSYGYTDYGP